MSARVIICAILGSTNPPRQNQSLRSSPTKSKDRKGINNISTNFSYRLFEVYPSLRLLLSFVANFVCVLVACIFLVFLIGLGLLVSMKVVP